MQYMSFESWARGKQFLQMITIGSVSKTEKLACHLLLH